MSAPAEGTGNGEASSDVVASSVVDNVFRLHSVLVHSVGGRQAAMNGCDMK